MTYYKKLKTKVFDLNLIRGEVYDRYGIEEEGNFIGVSYGKFYLQDKKSQHSIESFLNNIPENKRHLFSKSYMSSNYTIYPHIDDKINSVVNIYVKVNGGITTFHKKKSDDVKDIKETLKKIQVAIPDLLIISANSDYSMKVLEEIVELKIHIPMIAIQNCNSDISMKEKNLSDIQEYIICPAQWHKTLAYQDDIFGSTNDYAKQFENNYNYDPPSHVAQSSAAVLLYKDVLERADSFDANKIKDALTKTDLMTFFGPIKFNENGHNIYKQFLLIQIQEGKNMIVAPEKFADTELIFPMPKMPD